MELSAGSYVLAMTSIGDKKDGMDRLVKALYEIDEELDKKELFNKKGEKKNRIMWITFQKEQTVVKKALNSTVINYQN